MKIIKNNNIGMQKKRKVTFILFAVLLGLMISYAAYIVHIHSIYGQTCFTPATVASDSRCLFILSGNVYNKGTRAAPHQGNTCGTDVTSFIPSFHAGSAAVYLDPNFVGTICVPTATPVPTNTPIPTNTPAPTNTPIPTNTPVPCSLKSSGDADCNGVIDLADIEVFRKEYTGSLQTKNSDFNKDTRIDLVDFEIWRKVYLK